MDGDPGFLQAARAIAFGGLESPNVASVQTLSGTGAVFVAGKFLTKFFDRAPLAIHLPAPTWPLHPGVLRQAGVRSLPSYPYYDSARNQLNFEGMIRYMKTLGAHSVFLLHACAHNPTGMDPTREQWIEIIRVCKERQLFPFIDMAYQGFASGDLDRDAEAVRMFAREGLEFLVAQSFAKNAGLYAERVGALHVFCKSAAIAETVLSQLKMTIRMTYSANPIHGARIISKIYHTPGLFSDWTQELTRVSGRMRSVRLLLRDRLVELGTPGNWDHIVRQIGLFSYSGLTGIRVICWIV